MGERHENQRLTHGFGATLKDQCPSNLELRPLGQVSTQKGGLQLAIDGKRVLDRFRVVRTLKEESGLQTFLGVDERQAGPTAGVVIRLYREPLGRGALPCQVALFDRLATLTQMRQPGIEPLVDFGQFEGRLVLVSTYRPGTPLSELCLQSKCRNISVTVDMAIALARSLCDSLQGLRDRYGMAGLHGRISPDFIYLPHGQPPQLGGLGALAIGDAASEAEVRVSGMQEAVGYAAPEVVRGDSVSESADVYAITLVLYRLLSGANPFLGRTVSETLQRVMALVPARLTLPQEPHADVLNEVLLRGLNKDPRQRFSSLKQLAAALGECCVVGSPEVLRQLDSLVTELPWTAWLTSTESKRGPVIEELDTEPGIVPMLGAAGGPVESGFPAFASGLLTEQPRSVSEHTQAHTRQLGPLRRWRSGLAVAVPTAALLVGLVLGRVEPISSPEQGSIASSSFAPVMSPSAQLGQDSVESLRQRIRMCTRMSSPPQHDARVVIQLQRVDWPQDAKVYPTAWAETSTGLCVLNAARASAIVMPGAASLVIPVQWSDDTSRSDD